MKRFILLCHARTGSSLLHEAIRHRPDAIMHGEVLSEHLAVRRTDWPVDGRWLAEGEDGATFLREVVFAPPRPVAAIGFKLMYVHARTPAAASAWSWLAEDRDLVVLQLLRADLLGCLVSLEAAIRSSQWRVAVGSPEALREVPPFALDPKRCADYFATTLERIRAGEALFAGHPRLDLEYRRDLEENFAPTVAKVEAALGLAPRAVTPALLKQATRPVREQLLNYAELRDHFAATDYARYFE